MSRSKIMLTEAIKEDKKKHTRTVTDIEHTNNIFRTRLFFTSLAFEKKDTNRFGPSLNDRIF